MCDVLLFSYSQRYTVYFWNESAVFIQAVTLPSNVITYNYIYIAHTNKNSYMVSISFF